MIKKTISCILIIASALLIVSCKNKKKSAITDTPEAVNTEIVNGLPDNPKLVNGYLYSCNQTTKYANSSSFYYSFYVYVAFSDPARNILATFNHFSNSKNFSSNNGGNIDVGSVSLNQNTINKNFLSSELYYTSNLSGQSFSNTNASWSTVGNNTFKPINVSLSRGYPLINTNSLIVNTTVLKSQDLYINFGNYISNFDSLIVSLEDGMSRVIKKTVPVGSNSVTFTTSDMINLNTSSYGKIKFVALNYSNMIINNKLNLFELNTQYSIESLNISN